MIVARIAASILLSISIFYSCNSKRQKLANNIDDSSTIKRKGDTVERLLTTEEAETIISKYFSEQNREKGYMHYKGLFLNVDTILYPENSRYTIIKSTITGRETKSASDTTTIPYALNDSFRVIYRLNNWVLAK